jgi:glycosyltransferase involved in cell wall biosynthesis
MSNLSVLVIHNRYQQPGGEDAVVRAEVAELRRRGHRVVQYTRDNTDIVRYGLLRKGTLPFSAAWNPRTYAAVRALIRRERPDIAHVHNFFPLISPAAHHACKSLGLPVMQTLHNYRLLCPAATLFVDGQRCSEGSRRPARCIQRGCYRNSQTQTAAVCAMLAAHRLAGSWQRSVDAYLVPSNFCRDRFAAAGLPANKIVVKHNLLPHDPGPRTSRGDYALFVGRLSAEKGVLEIVRAWAQLPDVPLLIAGDGPLRAEIERALAGAQARVNLLGHLDPEAVVAYIKGARFLVFPSRWDEPFGMALIEAAACGVPAIAAHVGAVPELVADGETGLLFDPDNFEELVQHARWAWSHVAEMEQMGRAARQLYLQKFTADRSYDAWASVCGTLLK